MREAWELCEVSLFITERTSISPVRLALEEGSSRLPSGSLVVLADMGGSSVPEERSTVTVCALNWAATSADLRDDLFPLEGFVGDRVEFACPRFHRCSYASGLCWQEQLSKTRLYCFRNIHSPIASVLGLLVFFFSLTRLFEGSIFLLLS